MREAFRLAVVPDRSVDSLCGFVRKRRRLRIADRHRRLGWLCGLRKRGFDHHAIAECGKAHLRNALLDAPLTGGKPFFAREVGT